MKGSTKRLVAAVFDLDGVVTLTAGVHGAAWKRLFDELLRKRAAETGDTFRPFDLSGDYRTFVDGKPRIDGVRSFLASRGISVPDGTPTDPPGDETAWAMGNLKNDYFHAALEEHGVDVDEATVETVRALRANGVRAAVASSSKNCGPILERAGLLSLFEASVDGIVSERLGLRGKPEPDIFVEAARRVGATPAQTLVVEDAISGVAAARAGEFGLVVGLDRGGGGLRQHGADLVFQSLAAVSVETLMAWFSDREHRRPSALTDDRLWARLEAGRPAIFLDYDGTLTPIVDRPERATISRDVRETVRALASVYPTAIISGRGREDVAALVGVSDLVVAGSHGFDISGPGGLSLELDRAREVRPVIAELADQFRTEVADIEGAIVEDKRFSLALHYRLVAAEQVSRIERLVDAAVARYPVLCKTLGKKVFELRPDIAWDKGRAVLWLLDVLDLDQPGVVPVYVGDDLTDEDAFAALAPRGVGVVVTETPRPSAARHWLQNPAEVHVFLQRLAAAPRGGG